MKSSLKNIFGSQGFNRKYLNKFSVTFIVYAVWMIFFDNYNMRTQLNLNRIINEMNAEKDKFSQLYSKALKEREILQNDQERYAREKYFMHKDNEEVFIINKKSEIKP